MKYALKKNRFVTCIGTWSNMKVFYMYYTVTVNGFSIVKCKQPCVEQIDRSAADVLSSRSLEP